MGERLVATDSVEVDRSFVARLLLGALPEHEQRLLALRLIGRDSAFRDEVAAGLEEFQMFDLDCFEEYARVLAEGRDVESRRAAILHRSYERAGDLGQLIRDFTFDDVFRLGGVTPRFFSWSMAEHLLERTRRQGESESRVMTSLYLAMTVIDVVELLGAAGRAPRWPAVIADVRRRIYEATRRPPGQTGR